MSKLVQKTSAALKDVAERAADVNPSRLYKENSSLLMLDVSSDNLDVVAVPKPKEQPKPRLSVPKVSNQCNWNDHYALLFVKADK